MKKYELKNSEYTIYVLLHKSSKTFFVDFSTEKLLLNSYSKHFSERNLKTKNWISKLKLSQEKPCIIPLENLFSNRYECFKLVLVWTKIFLENNFSSIANDSFIEEAQTIYEENFELYKENRKHISISEIIDCKNCVLPNYSHIKCSEYTENGIEKLKRKPSSKKRIEIRVDEDEKQIIEEAAAEEGMPLASFIKARAIEGKIVIIDHSEELNDALVKANEINHFLNSKLNMLIETNDWYNEDMIEIKNGIDELTRCFKLASKNIKAKNRRK